MSSVNVTVSGSGTVAATVSGGVGPQGPAGPAGTGVQSVNALTGAVQIIAGSNVTVLTGGTTVSISATGGGGGGSGTITSVNGQTGATVVLSAVDVTAAAAVHTHGTSDVTLFRAAASDAAPVQSVNGKTGTLVLSAVDVTAAGTAVLLSLNGLTGAASIVAGSGVSVAAGGTTVTVSSLSSLTAAQAGALAYLQWRSFK